MLLPQGKRRGEVSEMELSLWDDMFMGSALSAVGKAGAEQHVQF